VKGEVLDLDGLKPEDIQFVLHELQVHQVELTMQNEELHRAQLELETSRDLYSELYHSAPAGYCTLNRTGRILDANQTLAAMLGVEKENLIGNLLSRFVDHDCQDDIYLHRQRILADGQRQVCEIQLVRASGEKFWVRMESVPAPGDGHRIRSILSDITERKRAEQRIAVEKEWFRITLSSIGDAVITTDPDGKVTFLNPVAEQLTGWTSPEVYGLPVAQVFPIFDERTRQPLENPMGAVVQSGQMVGLANHTALISRDGAAIPIEDSAAPIRDAGGQLLGVVMVFHDVSHKRQVEMRLRESRDRLVQTTEAAEIGLWDWDLQSGSLTWDERGRTMFDLPAEAPLSYAVFLQTIHPEDRAGVEEATQAALAAQTILRAEYRIVWPDGSLHWIYSRGQAVYDEGGTPAQMFGVVMDITDRKTVEAEIHATQARLEVQRRLIEQREQERQRIARDLHDGPVQALLAATYALHGLRRDNCVPEISQALEEIQNSVQDQVNELRAYAGELRPPILSRFGLAKAIQSHLEGFQGKHPGIRFQFEDDSAGPLLPEPVRVTLYRIYQESLANIVRHARASEVAVRLTKTDHHALLEIQDNGVGFAVSADWLDLARHGHLGLVGMRERAEAVGGTLTVISQPSQGTRIRVVVPIE
jgi:PAS domain S-box-containing protein